MDVEYANDVAENENTHDNQNTEVPPLSNSPVNNNNQLDSNDVQNDNGFAFDDPQDATAHFNSNVNGNNAANWSSNE